MYVKIMSGENIPDDDSRKGFRLIDGVEDVTFGRTDAGTLMVDMLLFDGSRLVTYPKGNVYVLDMAGEVVQSMAVAPYHEDGEVGDEPGPEDILGMLFGVETRVGDVSEAVFFATNFRPSDDFAQKPMYTTGFENEMRQVRETVDMMGVLLAEHGHTWTPDQRRAYEVAIQTLNEQIGDVPLPNSGDVLLGKALGILRGAHANDDTIEAASRWADDYVKLFYALISPEEGMHPIEAFVTVEDRRRNGR